MRKKHKSKKHKSKKINTDNLVDIRTVKVDENLPKEERILEFVRQIKDPYHYKCGKFIVTARFAKDGPAIEDCLIKVMLDNEVERIMGNHIK